MEMLMCRSCGEFVRAIIDGDSLLPKSDECPDCGGREFIDHEADEHVQTN